MNELLPRLEPLKGHFVGPYRSLVDISYEKDDIEAKGPTIRFSIAIGNTGKGPLYIILGDIKKQDGKEIALAKQRIFNENGEFREIDVGHFELHRHEGHGHDHAHWHYDGLASLELLDSNGRVLETSKKNSYCVVDVFKYKDLPGSPQSEQFALEMCETEKTPKVGISVGWADYYRPRADRQYIEIDKIKSGKYSLKFKINKTKLVYEISESTSFEIYLDKEKGEVKPI